MTSRRRAKIVATLGPASSDPRTVRELVDAGLDVARINFSHGDERSWLQAVDSVRRAQAETGKPVAILGDLQGPKIRIGSVPDGAEIARGERVEIITGSDAPGRYDDDGRLTLSCPYAALIDEVEVGGRIYLRDGELDLRIEAIDGPRICTTVRGGGLLTARAGLHAPGAGLLLPAVTEDDRLNAGFAVRNGFDFLALSFVRDRGDLDVARDAVAAADGDLPIISKIETLSAINDLDAIIDASDGAMVARGDLGVEVGPAEVPLAQREIITAAGRALMPVIIATQMLESMTTRARPTRAEASDVANAVLDGTDAVMLSAETSMGKYPTEAVEFMDRIASEADGAEMQEAQTADVRQDPARAVVLSAKNLARNLHASALTVFTSSGRTALLLSKQRPSAPVFAFTGSAAVHQRMTLYWGVTPILAPLATQTSEMVSFMEELLAGQGLVRSGERIIVVGSTPLTSRGRTNFLKVHTVRRPGRRGRTPKAR